MPASAFHRAADGCSWAYWIPAAATAALIFFVSHQPALPDVAAATPDWLAHIIAYAFFTATLVFGATQGLRAELWTTWRVFAAAAVASAYGITDEFHQSFVGRDPTVADWLADSAGALLAVAVFVACRRIAARPARV